MIVVLAPFNMVYIPSTLIVPGAATLTADHIMAKELVTTIGFLLQLRQREVVT